MRFIGDSVVNSNESFLKSKVANRSILLSALVDSGNLSEDLISLDLFARLGIKKEAANVNLRSPDKSALEVLGRARPFKIYIEGIPRPFMVAP